jgi:hypothetical protein
LPLARRYAADAASRCHYFAAMAAAFAALAAFFDFAALRRFRLSLPLMLCHARFSLLPPPPDTLTPIFDAAAMAAAFDAPLRFSPPLIA